jgi:hypothetical protein
MPTRYSESGALTLDTNSSGALTSEYMVVEGASFKSIYVVPATGTHATHQVQVQGSPDGGTTWFDMWTAITGKSMLMHQPCQCAIMRAKVTVVEGAPSTCDIYFFSTD